MTTLLMIAKSNDPVDSVTKILTAVGGLRRAPGLIVKTWSTDDDLRNGIKETAAEYSISRLEVVAHGSPGQLFSAEASIINCAQLNCRLRGMGEYLEDDAEVRLLSCEFARDLPSAAGWHFEPFVALAFLASAIAVEGKRLTIAGSTVSVDASDFGPNGFNESSVTPLRRGTV